MIIKNFNFKNLKLDSMPILSPKLWMLLWKLWVKLRSILQLLIKIEF